MDKLKMHSPNLVDANIEKIAALFPNCVTEAQGENGELKKAIDFDLLKQELSQVIVEGEQERYRLDWVGKKEAILTANAPIAKTLRPCRDESVNFDKTENLFIEGDNLEALKLLQENYLGKVKMIYIDPPYNTGNDFIYEDDFAESTEAFFEKSNQVDEEGNRLIANTESNGRFHSDWLSMIYSRLKLARNLLKDDGIIFISCDNNEQENLKKICSEIFGQKNFLANIIWKNGRTAAAHFTHEHEYILVYSKNIIQLPLFKYYGDDFISDRTIKKPSAKNPLSHISFPAGIDFESEDKEFPVEFGDKEPVKVIRGNFIAKDGKLAEPVTLEAAWAMADMIKNWLQGKETFDQKGQRVVKFFFKKNGVLQYLKEKGTIHPKTIIEGFTTKQGGNDVEKLLGKNYFDYPKPVNMLKELIKNVTSKNDLILDFFAGSSSTAHAMLQLNAEDGGNRKFIMVQLPEKIDEESEAFKAGFKTISEISKERIRRAGKTTLEDNAPKEGVDNLDIGFRVLKIDSSCMKDVYYTPDAIKQSDLIEMASNIKEDRTSEDLLFQVMLDWGLELSLPIERKTVAGKEVFYVAGNSLVACFDELTFDVVDEVAKDHPLRFVSAEKAIHLDHDKTNIKERFKLLSPDTEVKFL
ncbi:TPA: site-specific DNA-methyltransferase [Acinetobacter baumannii]|uniref:site-specific DNA-methyltransferase n=1 Tax=Acinetobacter baumannii TaxID=470 RepID=UPI0002CE15F6|nr:site-specific DNA-methyltransferase [Acinetobacter baumannii]ENW41273.1 hypothetical protein F919_03627 [Acinetobacter baumannii NIPH 329]HDX6160745.1 site-specific DNA-methyltransferase [Acinetobacter baumannii]